MNRFLLLFFVAFMVGDAYAKLPANIKVCSRNERNLADCIYKSVKIIQPSLASGNLGPGFQLPPLEPFAIDRISVGGGNDFKAVFTNLLIRGPSKFKIEKLRANLNDLRFDFIITFPYLDIRGKYDMVFRLFGFNLKGRGDMYALMDNPRARVSMRATKYQQNGQTFINFEKIGLKIQPGKFRNIKLENLFDNPALEEIGHAFINSNSEFLLNDVYPDIEKNLSDLLTRVTNQITGQASFDELFPNI